MKNRVLRILLSCALLLSLCAPALAVEGPLIAPNPLIAPQPGYVVLRLACPEGKDMSWAQYSRLCARFADDGTLIPLSRYYDGNVFATVPAAYAGRAIEVVMTEEVVFSDQIPFQYEFSVMGSLSALGVIQGDETGAARPFASVTRAEAAAMITRVMGLDKLEVGPSGFADVPETAWFAPYVAVARAQGIIRGVSETEFAPQRLVTREEITVMAARAFQSAGLLRQVGEPVTFVDQALIHDWAAEAYALVGRYVDGRTEYDETRRDSDGAYLALRYADPLENATRYACAYVLHELLRSCQVYPSSLALEYGFDQAMPVIDGSTSTYPFTQAVYQAMFSNSFCHPSMPQAHSKSHASYERLIHGEVDMLFASSLPTADLEALAAEQGVALEFHQIAYDAMVFFTNADNPAVGLSSQQISSIYVDNAYESWKPLGGPEALLYPYCRNNDSGSHAHMQRFFLNGSEINADIRQETTSTTMANVLTDVMAAQTAEPLGYGLGYSIFYYYHGSDGIYDTKARLKLLEIDGVLPTDETIADGSYPLCSAAYVVLRADTPEDAPARRMLDFMNTAAGQACVENAGYGRLRK